MIQNDHELQKAREWIEYWKTNRSGQVSWLGREQAAREIVKFRSQIDAYLARQAGSPDGDKGLKHAEESPSLT